MNKKFLRALYIVLGVLGVVLVGLGVWIGPQIAQAVAGTGSTTVAQASPTAVAMVPSGTAAPSATAGPTNTPAPNAVCGGPGQMYILAVGTDYRGTDYAYGLADVIRVARVDFVHPGVSAIAFPRDMWVQIPGISDHYGITQGKINQAYFWGSPSMGYYNGPNGGAGLLADTLKANFDLPTDHFAVVDMNAFPQIIDAVGGVDIVLAQPVDGSPINPGAEDLGQYPAGKNHLDGKTALKFVRIRQRYSDLQRIDNQSLVLKALLEKLRSPSIILEAPRLYSILKDSVLTDLGLPEVTQLACLMTKVGSSDLRFVDLPQSALHAQSTYSASLGGDTYTLQWDAQPVRDFVSAFKAGSLP